VTESKSSGINRIRTGSVSYSLDHETSSNIFQSIVASTAMFNHVGDGIILTHHSEHSVRIMDYPSLTLRESPAAHVGGCVAVALDPRGRFVLTVISEPYASMSSLGILRLEAMTPLSTCLI